MKPWSRITKPSLLAVLTERNPDHIYMPTSYLRIHDGVLQQAWWSQEGDSVWEPIPEGDLTLKELASGEKS